MSKAEDSLKIKFITTFFAVCPETKPKQMADFGYFSDADDSAVEDLISQTKELCVLEQVSAINCSGFTDSVLPTELERRFNKLKSCPVTKPKTSITDNRHIHTDCVTSLHHSKSEVLFDSKQNPDGNAGWRGELVSGYDSSPLNSSDSSTGNGIFSETKQNPDEKMVFNEKSKRGPVPVPVHFPSPSEHSKSKSKSKTNSFSSAWSSPSSWLDSPSPPQKKGCFWCSPKSVPGKKSRENPIVGNDLDWCKTDEFLSDLSTLSFEEQQKMLRKAMKEDEKVSREAEKIVKWAKQASMRMSVHGTHDDELSDG